MKQAELLIEYIIKNIDKVESERLMRKLLVNDGYRNKYIFESGIRFEEKYIHGIVQKDLPGIECPAAFSFIWSKRPSDKDFTSKYVKKFLEIILNSDLPYQSHVLVTINDQPNEAEEWLSDNFSFVDTNKDIHHYGHKKIQELLDGYPALKKYYVSKCGLVEDPSKNFITIREEYNRQVAEKLKHLDFVGLPTGSYQKQYSQGKPELEKIYIPLGFTVNKDDRGKIILPVIMKKSKRVVVLGSPGSGKTTLANYLALIYSREVIDKKKVKIEKKTPFIIPIREFVRKKGEYSQIFDFIDYLKFDFETNYNFRNIDKDFFIALLELGEAVVVFEGLDEVALEENKIQIVKSIEQFSLRYQDIAIWVTSRIAGYTEPVTLNPDQFDLYYLASVSQQQAKKFIEKWFKIQLPIDETLRNDRIQSLQQAIEKNPGIKPLKSNPLLLTMMTLIHQFEGTLPDNRARLYEKCVELMLKTWQDQKYNGSSVKNPLEERGLKYDIQLRMLANAALHIQEKFIYSKVKDANKTDEDSRLIEEKELSKVLFGSRFDKKRMTEEKAKEDVRFFIDYIRYRTGLLVEKEQNEKGENLFSFVHLSFLDYLTAYQIAEDRSKSPQKHIQQLLERLEITEYWEPILLALQLFARSIGPSFIDDFTEAVFKKISTDKHSIGWLLMGRAVRDNIDFTLKDIKHIIEHTVNIWMEDSENKLVQSVLEEVVHFSKEGEKILRQVLKENVKNNPASQAFKALCFFKKYYGIDASIKGVISKSSDYTNLLAYLPVYRNDNILKSYIKNNLGINQWFIYFNSASDKTLENLDILLKGEENPIELKGYLLSSWRHIFKRFQDHSRFLEQNKKGFDEYKKKFICQYNFGNYNSIHLPLLMFMPYVNFPIHLTESLSLTNKRFISEDQKHTPLPKDIFIKRWVDKIAEKTLGQFEHHPSIKQPFSRDDKKYLMGMMSRFGESFFRGFLRNNNQHNLIRDFFQDLLKGSSYDFLQRFTQLLKQYLTGTGKSIQDVLWDFNREFTENLTMGSLKKFSRTFIQYINLNFLKDFFSNFLRDHIHNLNPSVKDLISGLYRKKFKKKLEWEDLSGSDYQGLNKLYVDEFPKGHPRFIEAFFSNLYVFLFYNNFHVSIEPMVDSLAPQSLSLSESSGISPTGILMSNSFMIPFTFGFQLAAALNHFLIHIFSDWLMKFYNEDTLETQMISDAFDTYCAKHPFILYIIHSCWDFYARDFNENYQDKRNNQLSNLKLASFIVNAAKVSLATGIPCEGNEWEKILEKAEKTNNKDLFIDISLNLYRLCNFQEREKNSELLKNFLQKFKLDFPQDYKLLGVTY